MRKILLATLVLTCPLLVQPAPAREAAKDAPKETSKETPKETSKETPKAGAAKPARTPSAGQTAARERQKTCGTEWRGLSDAQKTAQGPKWPQFWSKCNTRLKGEKA